MTPTPAHATIAREAPIEDVSARNEVVADKGASNRPLQPTIAAGATETETQVRIPVPSVSGRARFLQPAACRSQSVRSGAQIRMPIPATRR